jgi:hypothetical protein
MMGNFRLSFGRAVKSLCVLDAAFLLVLTMGFVVPPKTLQDSRTGAIPRELYDDSAKMSPLAPPAPEPAHVKTTVPVNHRERRSSDICSGVAGGHGRYQSRLTYIPRVARSASAAKSINNSKNAGD